MMYHIFKLSKIAKPAALLLAAVITLTAAFALVEGASPAFAGKENKLPSVKAKNEEQRQELLTKLGWETSELSPVEEEVLIPKAFDEVYSKYNALQRQQGLDLKRYRGKKVTKLTYFIKNYPQEATNVRLTLLLKNGKVIGGDVCSLGLNGFMHSLFYPTEGMAKA
ncbi:MAG: DUF4830 domain-containing protein [Oscillospiraceae bacterium]